MYDLCIIGGVVVDSAGPRRCDVYVNNGRIAALTDGQEVKEAREVVDAAGQWLLPGVIDAHTHFRTYSKHCDGFADMAMSAGYGGVTTVLAFIMGMNATQRTMAQRITEFMEEAALGAVVDYGFHVGLADEPGALDDIDFALDQGITSFKMFMAYRQRGLMVRDDFMLKAMRKIARADGLAMVHAEAGDIIDALAEETPLSLPGPDAFARTRPAWTEAEAARRAARLASEADCPVYFVHISSEEALEVLLEARNAGQRLYIETCPQYLNLTHETVHACGALAKIAPPLRYQNDVEALRAAVVSGDVDVVASDHAPYTVREKGDASAFLDAPVGAPGTETLIVSTLHAILEAGGSVETAVRLLCEAPARIFRIADRKGSIAVGSDADVTLVDPNESTTVRGEVQHNQSGYSLYDGLKAPIRVVSSYVRGQLVLHEGEIASANIGEFIPRTTNPSPALAAARST